MTHRQKKFVQEYLRDLDAVAAAERAGYSAATARRRALEFLRHPEIAEALSRVVFQQEETFEIRKAVLAELAHMAFGDLREVAHWGPNGLSVRPSDELDAAQAALVAEVSESRTRTGNSVKLKRYDKLKALELLGRHLGLFRESACREQPQDEKPRDETGPAPEVRDLLHRLGQDAAPAHASPEETDPAFSGEPS